MGRVINAPTGYKVAQYIVQTNTSTGLHYNRQLCVYCISPVIAINIQVAYSMIVAHFCPAIVQSASLADWTFLPFCQRAFCFQVPIFSCMKTTQQYSTTDVSVHVSSETVPSTYVVQILHYSRLPTINMTPHRVIHFTSKKTSTISLLLESLSHRIAHISQV